MILDRVKKETIFSFEFTDQINENSNIYFSALIFFCWINATVQQNERFAWYFFTLIKEMIFIDCIW